MTGDVGSPGSARPSESSQQAALPVVSSLLVRLDAVEQALRAAAERDPSAALTDPDPSSGERWEAGQVWAHLSEIVPYWINEAKLVLAAEVTEPAIGDQAEPVPFGRVKSDPDRIAAIADRRHESTGVLAAKVFEDIDALRSFLVELDGRPQAWERSGHHSTLGVMDLDGIFDEFLVGHLEQHLRQLDAIAGAPGGN